jgi:hypothetical protein
LAAAGAALCASIAAFSLSRLASVAVQKSAALPPRVRHADF